MYMYLYRKHSGRKKYKNGIKHITGQGFFNFYRVYMNQSFKLQYKIYYKNLGN